ncbi:MAG: CotH kinase family protein, partial [Cytophagaceae bacterium]
MKILYTTLFTLIISAGLCQGQSLKINEIMNWNTSTLKDGSGNYNPWVELYNSGPSPIDLQGYFLADHEYLLKRWEFPSVSIAAGDYLIVFLSGKEKGVAGEIHSDIKITSSWQGIYLSDPSGQLIDKCRYQSMGLDISYGRSTDGGSAFAFFNQPTPGASNNTTPYASAAEAPIFSHRAGFYQNAFRLSISNPDPSAEVRYTLDGSDPTSSSPLYTGPIQISSRASDPNTISMIQSSFNSYWLPPSGNVEKYSIVKARIFKAGHIDGEIATSTYFIDSNIKNRFNMPVVSLSTDPANFFDYTKGIYVPGKTFDDALAANPSMPIGETTPANFTMKGDDWARPCYIEYFESSGLGGFAQAASVDIHGAFSRLYRQHALNVKAGKGFDDPKSIDYPVFPGLVQTSGITKSKSKYLVSKDITKFKTLMLRNNGSDWGYTMFRDALAGSLFAHRNLSVQAYRPCVVYLNGEYWGIHDLREKFDQDYLEAHYGIPKTNSLILYNEGATYQGDSLLADDYTD